MVLPQDLQEKMDREVAAAATNSFDGPKFELDLRSGDSITMLIRAHLYLEHVLIQTLLDAFEHPNEMQLRNINFPAKLNLGIAMGIIGQEWRQPVTLVNQIRNKVAHRLDYQFTEVEKLEIFESLPDWAKKIVTSDAKTEDVNAMEWWHLLASVVAILDLLRQRVAVNRVKERIGHEHLRRVLDRK